MESKCAIFVISCDKYEVLWRAFFNRFFYFWPVEENNVYLITNNLRPNLPGVNVINGGNSDNWSACLKIALCEVDYDYVYVLLDDIFIKDTVSKEKFSELLRFCIENNAEYLNTKALPMPKGKTVYSGIKTLPIGTHYRASLCNAFWKRETLISLLKDGETPWQFEINGTRRSRECEKFYGTLKPLIKFKHLIVSGKISEKFDNFDVDVEMISSKFETMTSLEKIKNKISGFRGRLFVRLIPSHLQTKMRSFFKNNFDAQHN